MALALVGGLLLLPPMAALRAAPPAPPGAAGAGTLSARPHAAPGPRSLAAAPAGAVEGWQSDSLPAHFPGLFYPSVAADPSDNATLLFGGCTGVLCPSGATNATWTFAGGRWSPISGPAPSPRGEAQMAWDPADQMVMLFGGTGCRDPPACTVNGPLNDTWGFSRGHWFPVATSGSPPPTDEGGLAYDPSSQQMVLFGGLSCFVACGTWTYAAGAWAPLNVSGPQFRYGEGFAEDDSDQGAVLYGGVAGGTYMSDTWLYASGAWRRIDVPSPAQRADMAMGWDPALGAVVMFGGHYVTLSNFPGVTYGDTWTFAQAAWTAWTGTSHPGARSSAAGAEDPSTGAFVLTGGCGPSGCPYTDSWRFGRLDGVTLDSPDPTCVNATLHGQPGELNRSETLLAGAYPLNLTACPGFDVANVTASAGLEVTTLSANNAYWNGTVTVSGPGTVIVNLTTAVPPTTQGRAPAGAAMGGTTYLLVGIAVAAAAGAAGALVLVRRRRRPPPPGGVLPPTPDALPSPGDASEGVGPPAPGSPVR